jgi:hypothetical protein
MSFKDFRVLETVGKGSFASVYKVGAWYGGCGDREPLQGSKPSFLLTKSMTICSIGL